MTTGKKLGKQRIAKSAIVGILALAAFAADADTVAWWHFDELADGVKATNYTSPFLNSVDSSKHAAFVCSKPLKDGNWRLDSGELPQGVTAFPDYGVLVDPIGGTKTANSLGVAFRPSIGTGTRGTGPALVIPYSAELCPRNCTWEFFIKPTPTPDNTTQHLVFTRAFVNDGTTNCGLRLYYSAGSDYLGFFTYQRADGLTNNVEIKTSSNFGLANGRWHHVAITMDNDRHVLSLFVDYTLIGSLTLLIDCSLTTQEYVFGGSKNDNWGCYEGYVDEFRISDRVLEPYEFLQVNDEGPALVLPQTAVYQRFSELPDFVGPGVGVTNSVLLLRNEAPAAASLGNPNVTLWGDGFFATADVPVANVMTGLVGSAAATNRSAVSCRSNAASRENRGGSSGDLCKSCPCWNFKDPGAAVSTNDFTAEMFFRTTNVTYSTYFFCIGQPAYTVLARGGNNGINVNGTTVVSESISDGRWHHLALVADGETHTAQLYLDYKPRGDPVAMVTGSYNEYIAVGSYQGLGFVTFYDVDFDDVRITRTCLDVVDFLHFAKSDDVVSNLDFDQRSPTFDQMWTARWNVSYTRTMNASASTTYDQADKPGTFAADGLFDEKVANVSSERVIGGSGQSGSGYRKLSGDTIAALPSGDFTVEFEAKFPANDYENYTGGAAYIVTHPKKDSTDPMWQIGFIPSGNSNAGRLKFATGYTNFATCEPNKWMDGEWHHFAIVHDSVRNELRAYLDHSLVGTKTGASLPSEARNELFLGAGSAYSWGNTFGVHSWWLDNFRITKKALKPCEFKTSKFLAGDTLVWAPFDRNGRLISEIGLAPTFSGSAWAVGAGVLKDAVGNTVRERNAGAFSTSAGAGAYSRLSLIEMPDVSVEFFVKFNGAVANDTDIVKLAGSGGAPIWSIRKKSDGKLHVMATPQGGSLTDLGAFADVCADRHWRHVVVTFEPSDDGSSTSVSAWLNHERVGEPVQFAGTLAVKGIADSSLTCGAFDGSVDELRVLKGVLDASDMLYAVEMGSMLIVY